MPVETSVTRCGNCGATLGPRGDAVEITCTYCHETTYLAPTRTAPMPVRPPPMTVTASADYDSQSDLVHHLEHGPLPSPHGQGMRFSTDNVARRDPLSYERGVWPVRGRASSTFGGSWSPSALIGPPRVFPRCGDIGGAWAPGPSRSDTEWVEVEFAVDAPVTAVRVFETNRPGSTYAVVDLTNGEKLLWAAPPVSESGAQMLEVSVTPPRPVRKVRVYVVNPGWAEIDTVGTLAYAPLPEAMRTRAAPPAKAFPMGALFGAAVVAIIVAAGVVALLASSGSTHPHDVRPATPPPPPTVVAGATMRYSNPAPEALAARNVTWASAVEGFSTEFSTTRNEANGAVGAPDVYPRHGDIDGAWASHETDFGDEWITVRFASPTTASSVVWAETFNPGAVVRVDDVSVPSAPVTLWAGASGEVPTMAVIAEVTLPSPRVISAVRLMLDTRRVAGWNELDAVGLAR